VKAELKRPVTAEEIATYERDGVVVLRDIYPLEWVDRLRDAMDDVFARSAPSLQQGSMADGKAQAGSRSDMVERATQRRAASIRYAGDGVTFHHRRSSPEPFRNTIDLEEGEALENDPRFQVVLSS
jgi:hypothetical protein